MRTDDFEDLYYEETGAVGEFHKRYDKAMAGKEKANLPREAKRAIVKQKEDKLCRDIAVLARSLFDEMGATKDEAWRREEVYGAYTVYLDMECATDYSDRIAKGESNNYAFSEAIAPIKELVKIAQTNDIQGLSKHPFYQELKQSIEIATTEKAGF